MIVQEEVNLLISKNIRKLRVEGGESLQTLGELLGVSNQQVSKMELGKTRIFAAQLAVLADYYNVDASFFYTENQL